MPLTHVPVTPVIPPLPHHATVADPLPPLLDPLRFELRGRQQQARSLYAARKPFAPVGILSHRTLSAIAFRRDREETGWRMTWMSTSPWPLAGIPRGGGLSFDDLLAPADRAALDMQLENGSLHPSAIFQCLHGLPLPDGRHIMVWERGMFVREQDTLALEGLIVELPQSKRAEHLFSRLGGHPRIVTLGECGRVLLLEDPTPGL
ncbi:MAG: hypothetical protein H7831_14620 [Magnetococcus sp. WYHC-3]